MPLDFEGWLEIGWPASGETVEGWVGVISFGTFIGAWDAVSDHLFGLHKYSSAGDRLFADRGLPHDASLEVRQVFSREVGAEATCAMTPDELVSLMPAEAAMMGPTHATWAEVIGALQSSRTRMAVEAHPDRPSTLAFPHWDRVVADLSTIDEAPGNGRIYSDWNLVFALVDVLARSRRYPATHLRLVVWAFW